MKTVHMSKNQLLLIIFCFILLIAWLSLVSVLKSHQELPDSNEKLSSIVESISTCDRDISDYYRTEPKSCHGKPLLLILVISSPNHFKERMVIRSYIKSQFSSSNHTEGLLWRRVFVIAGTNNYHLQNRIYKEILQFKDILEENHREKKNDIVKKVLLSFAWANCRCKPKYLLKCNDNAFINIGSLSYWLLTNNTGNLKDNQYFTGITSTPILKAFSPGLIINEHQHHLSVHLYNPYVLDIGYLMSSDLIEPLLATVSVVPYFQNDGIFVGTLVRMTGVELRSNPNFHSRYNYIALPACSIRDIFVCGTSTSAEAAELFSLARLAYLCHPIINL